VGVLFIAALAIRLIGIKWGLPNQNYPYSLFLADEPNTLNATLILSKRQYDVGVLRNQPFFYLISFPVFVLYYLYSLLSGRIDNLADFEALYIQDNSEFLVVGRAFVAVVSALTVVLSYFVGKRMANRQVGLFSALFLLLSFGHVVYSTVYRLDPFLPFLFLLTFYLIIRLPDAKQGILRPYALCGLAMGLAATTKITAFAMIVPFLGSIMLNTPGLRKWPPRVREIDRRYPFAFTVFLATVVALTLPSYTFQPEIARSPVTRITEHDGSSGYTSTISPYRYSLPWHLTYILPLSVGWPIYLLSLSGLTMMLFDRKIRHSAILFWLTILAFMLPIGYLVRTAWRDMLPMLPFFAIAAGYCLWRALDLAYGVWPSLRQRIDKRVAAAAILVIVALWPAKEVLDHKRLIIQQDTRDIAKEWIEENIPAGTNLAIESYGPAVLDRSVEALIEARMATIERGPPTANKGRPIYGVYLLNQSMSSGRDMLQAELLPEYLFSNRIDYVVLSSGYYGRFYNDAVEIVFPQRASAAREYYDLIDENLTPVAEFLPDWHDTPGPVIKIYGVPERGEWRQSGFSSSGSFEPFAGMARPASAVGYYQFSPR
jgi:hypothetical protein